MRLARADDEGARDDPDGRRGLETVGWLTEEHPKHVGSPHEAHGPREHQRDDVLEVPVNVPAGRWSMWGS